MSATFPGKDRSAYLVEGERVKGFRETENGNMEWCTHKGMHTEMEDFTRGR